MRDHRSVCNRTFTKKTADLICKELNYNGFKDFTTRYEFNLNKRRTLRTQDDLPVSHLKCSKKANSLGDCVHTVITKVSQTKKYIYVNLGRLSMY